ncbi:MAG TPA: chemotaxis protein CheB [Chitinophagaceae bacterium]|nr:chemotaxis protein CheB [Chitinophagaceae bacterium]
MLKNVVKERVLPVKKGYVIGVGASAGGMEAIHSMFDAMPANTGFSFVVIQHLSPDYKSLLAELLSKHTNMQVCEAEDGMKILPDCIYVIPARKLITVVDGTLRLIEKPKSGMPNNAVDVFFSSLAAELGECAVGVILSGTGSDGKKGVEEIKEKGGIVIVQDPLTAAFDGMPNSAIGTGCADMVLPPEMIAEELLEFVKGTPSLRQFTSMSQNDETFLRQILNSIHNKTQFDFSHYKRPTVLRRLAKRMAELNIKNIEEYKNYIEANHEELQVLYRQFLINVTKFFRDPEAFNVLNTQVVPSIADRKKDGELIKVWIAACSSGEEAYSVAILFKEYLDKIHKKDSVLKIFATDIDSEALETASRGIYPDAAQKDIPAEYLEKYFIRENGVLRISPTIRKLIVFANHDIVKDPPFSHLDLICCRNMLIYIEPALQKKILRKFHFAFDVGSFLMLGISENISILKNSMQEIDRKWKIYKCITKIALPDTEGYLAPFENKVYAMAAAIPKAKNALQHVGEIFKDTLLEERKFAGILIDREFEVKHAVGNFKKYFKFPENNFNVNLLKILPQDLASILSINLRKAANEGETVVVKHAKVVEGDNINLINIIIKPYLQPKEYLQAFLFVILQEAGSRQQLPNLQVNNTPPDNNRIDELERELMETRENLQAIIEEIETANEELQSSNEEMISSNEELQSTNEELQSLNEELHTVSAEHQAKIKELLELNDDMNNYFRNSDIGQVIVDKSLCVKKFSPSVSRMVNLIEADIGRSIEDISINFFNPHFIVQIRDVMRKGENIEREISFDNNYYLMRITPYIRQDNTIDGAVINFVDITEVKTLDSTLKGIFNSSASGIVSVRPVKDDNGKIIDFEYTAANKSAEKLMHIDSADIVGKQMLKQFPETRRDFFEQCIQALETGLIKQHDYFNYRAGKWFEIVVMRMLDGLVITFTDITEKKKLANILQRNYEELKSTNAKLEASNMDLLQFASVASHDLKEPLRKVQAFGNLLQAKISGKLENEEALYLNKIISATTRMQMLIEDVLTLSKLSNTEINFEKTSLSKILKRIEEDLEINIKEKNAKINIGPLPEIKAVPGQMHQVFQNLISNALKFNDKPVPTVTVRTVDIDENIAKEFNINASKYIAVAVEDNGMGFEEQYKEKIFGIFQRLHGRNYEGTGIGLAIAKKIIENHNGYITADSEPGQGAKFLILLPLQQALVDAE